MDLATTAKQEIFRPTLIFLVPGFIAAFPFVFVLHHYQPGILELADGHPTVSTILGFVVSAVMGMIAYDIGANIEARWIDERLKKDDPTFQDNWYLYLRSVYPERAVAYSYIHEKVMTLKFELGMSAALPICMVGCIWAWAVTADFTCRWFISAVLGLLLGTAYFLYEATSTAEILATVRKEMLKGFRKSSDAEAA